jgi:hypothetical protein
LRYSIFSPALEGSPAEGVDIRPAGRKPVIGEGEPLETSNGLTKLSQAKEAIEAAVQTLRETTLSLADAIEAGRQPDTPLDRLARLTREAPLHALAAGFLLGLPLGRRRRF